MNLYANFSFLFSALKSHKLCGATEDGFLYLAEAHLGYTPRGPLHFGGGYYLRNGTTFQDPVLAAAGREFPIPLLVSLFTRDTIVKLPPLDERKNPREMVNEVLRAGFSKEHGVTFGFSIEVGAKRIRRESFERRKAPAVARGRREDGAQTTKALYTLHRLALSSATEHTDEDCEMVAMLPFNHILSLTHYFTLELKRSGLTGVLGDRWALMVVTTALGLYYLRQIGRTGKATVGAAQAIHGKQA
jgi:hypothetical protein